MPRKMRRSKDHLRRKSQRKLGYVGSAVYQAAT